MLTLTTRVHVADLTAKQAYEFLTTYDDEAYRLWYPGMHLKMIVRRRSSDHVGDVFFLDQFIGDRRVRAVETVVAAVPDKKIVRQIVLLGLRMPVQMHYDFAEDDAGVTITHTLFAGFRGLGRLLDPAFRRYFSPSFTADLDRHVGEELLQLRSLAVPI